MRSMATGRLAYIHRFRKVPPTFRLSKEAWPRATKSVRRVKTLVDHREIMRTLIGARVATRRANFCRVSIYDSQF